jgi:3-methylcrotonyl-CoA carboxylase beta subunit
VITGIGRVSGREVMIVANDATVKGGAYFPMTVKKHLRAQEIAAAEPPAVRLSGRQRRREPAAPGRGLPRPRPLRPHLLQPGPDERGGHRPDRLRHGLVHRRRRLCAGDERRDRDRPRPGHHLPGRPAAGEGRHGRGHLGRGAGRGRHPRPSLGRRRPRGQDDEHALEIVRSIVANLNTTKRVETEITDAKPPLYDPEELYGVVPTDVRAPYDVREVIARIVDGSQFDEFKALYGTTLVCGFARIWGQPVAILANNGVLFSESAVKGAHFIELACKRKIPLVFLQNISGFMVGGKYEAGGIAKDGAKLVTAVASAEVPKFTVLIGGSFGAGNYGMCGRAYSPRFLFTWPNSRISVMGGEQAASVLATVHRDAAKWTPEEAEAFKAPIRQRYEDEGNPYHATARLWDDGIIDPAQTRDVLGLAISASLNAPIPETTFGVFRM